MDSSYELKFKYKKNTRHPEKVFESMSELLVKFREFDEIMIESIPEIDRVEIELENLEIGSIKAKIKSVFEGIPDSFIENLDWKNFVGSYLVRAKYYIINKLSEKESLSSGEEIKEITDEIKTIAQEEMKRNVVISQYKLLNNLSGLSTVMKKLEEEDKIIYISSQGAIELNKKFDLKISQIEDLLSTEMKIFKFERILQIKKSDFLGKSKWDFYLDNHVINAKILDHVWLRKYQDRQIDLRPRDALKVKLKAIYTIDNNKVLKEDYEVLEVYEVITANQYEQLEF